MRHPSLHAVWGSSFALVGRALMLVWACLLSACSEPSTDGGVAQTSGDDVLDDPSGIDDGSGTDDAAPVPGDDSTSDDATDDDATDDVATDDDPSSTDDLVSDEPAPGPTTDGPAAPEPRGECPSECPIHAICRFCDDGSCALPEVECNADGTCGATEWICADNGDSEPACDDPNRRYAANSPEECAQVRFACEAGESAFSDECGCGCTTAPPMCEGIESLLLEEWEVAANCESDEDCSMRYNSLCGVNTPTLGSVGCYSAVGADSDLELLAELEAAVVECGALPADCDCAEPPPAGCRDGRCAPIDDSTLCADSGGQWMSGSCGHYQCGRQPACRALIPGCDCGPIQNFAPGFGCVPDPECGLD